MLLSGVVRNRKARSRARSLSYDGTVTSVQQDTILSQAWNVCFNNSVIQNFALRVHKFTFQWDLFWHLLVLVCSVTPFLYTGERTYSILPIAVWIFYNILFIIGTRQANRVVPGFRRFRLTFQASIEEFFSPKVLPIFSASFLLVVLSLSVTGHRLGGAPLCFSSCGTCLASWSASIPRQHPADTVKAGCGYENGEELLSIYTMAQTSFFSFFSVVLVMAVCMAWRVAKEELVDRKAAEDWLKSEDLLAYHLREGIIQKWGPPASPVRPEGNVPWVFFGVIAALSFILLGWHNWEKLPASYTYSLLILLNLLIILLSTLILHVGFFGRLITLYRRNYERVACLTDLVEDLNEQKMDSWWNCRNFVLNEDLALDYDIGGLAVSATFLITLSVFMVLAAQIYREGYDAMLEPPGSYCGYASLYLTCCLIRIFTLATSTFEEQRRHIVGLQKKSMMLLRRGTSSANLATPSDWEMHQLEDGGTKSPVPATSTASGTGGAASGTDDFENFAFDEADDFYFDDALGVEPTGNRTASPSLTHTLSNGALKLVSSLSRLSNSASSGALFGLERDGRRGEREGLLRGGRGIRRTGSAGAAEAAIAAADAEMKQQQHQQARETEAGGSEGTSAEAPLSIKVHSQSAISTPLAPTSPKGRSQPPGSGRKPMLPQIQRIMSDSLQGAGPPALKRTMSARGTMEASRQGLMEMTSQIRKYDPYPCILGIPVMPALFVTSKFYIFISFLLIGSRMMMTVIKTF